MENTIVMVDWTAVCTVIGVVFAVVLALVTAVIGNRVLGSYNLRIRKYELFFEQKCAAFTAYIEYAARIWAASDLKLLLGPEFEALSRRASLFAGQDTRNAIAKLNWGLAVWASASFEKNRAPDIMMLFSAVSENMQKELAEESGGHCLEKK